MDDPRPPGTDAFGLGRLQRIENLREVWSHEASDFTPWLAGNIELLGEAIGMPLTVVGQEVHIGEFRLDIHAVDPDGKTVIIENQLTPSDHLHLGQLLVYASGLEASTAVWITTRLREEHRSALTWLNERTDTSIRVFGIELGLVSIGQSARAPVLDVVVEPNDWSKVAKQSAAAGVSELDQARMAFFEQVFDQLGEAYSAIRAPRSKAASWWSFASGPFGYYSVTFSRKGYRIEIYLDTGQKDSTKALFDHLHAARAEIVQRLGFDLEWERLDANRGSRIACYYGSPLDPMTANQDELEAAARWSAAHIQALHSNLDQELRDLARRFTTKEQLDVLGSTGSET